MNEIFAVSGIGIVSAGLVILIKQYKPELAFGVAVSSGIIIILYVIGFFTEIFSVLSKIISYSGIGDERFSILFRCMGICIVTKIASETCRDCGQSSAASKIDLAGKALIISASLPLFSEIIELIRIFTEL